MKKAISLKINGLDRSTDVEPRTTLLDLVREQFGLTGAKLGCDIQVCGTCTVLLDECPRPSEEQIRDYLAGNFCRCGCYQEIMQAVKNVSGG